MNALEKYAAKKLLVEKLASKKKILQLGWDAISKLEPNLQRYALQKQMAHKAGKNTAYFSSQKRSDMLNAGPGKRPIVRRPTQKDWDFYNKPAHLKSMKEVHNYKPPTPTIQKIHGNQSWAQSAKRALKNYGKPPLREGTMARPSLLAKMPVHSK